MRNLYARQLSMLVAVLAELCARAETAMQIATQALLSSDLDLAEQVISDDERIDRLAQEGEERLVAFLALQAPVAQDLRVVVTGIRMTSALRRMGQLARHVALLVRRRHPRSVLDGVERELFVAMGQFAVSMAASVRAALITRDLGLVRRLQADESRMNDLHAELFTVILSPSWPGEIEDAVNIILLGRFYERFSDQAVDVAHRIEFLITGKPASAETPD